MTRIAKLLEHRVWQLRHRAASCLSVLEEGLVIVENGVGRNQERLIVLDDLFPSLATAFRIAEINAILSHFPTAVVYSSWPSRRGFRNYATSYPGLAHRVRRFSPSRRLRGSAAYVVFLNNIFSYLERIEEARLPFVFELYPGGGFGLNEPTSNARLQRVFGSPMFSKVIVTQSIAREYLLQKKLCEEQKIEFIFGGVVSSDSLHDIPSQRARYGLDKETVDICFVADKYMPRGVDKGYDRYIECAHALSGRYPEARFHVVGNFTEVDVDVSALRDRITFYGFRFTSFFPRFYSRMDIILSPNMPFVLSPGKFDGFPTGCCIEAGLCGTAVFATDELGMNEERLRDGEEIVIISPEPQQIAETVGEYIANPEQLASLGQNGQRAIRRLFSLDVQMSPRLRVLSDLLTGASRSLGS